MIPEAGHFALALALVVALLQAGLPLYGAARGAPRLIALATSCAQAQFALVALAFAALLQAHVTSDFTVTNVIQNSHTLKPLLYKVTGLWGNHEGSMLLWVFILTLMGVLVASFGHALPARFKARTLAVQALITAGFLAFLLFASNPFARTFPAPADGQGLNPILQDPGLAFHPPLLYLGYVGFSIVFSFAAAALIEGRADQSFAHFVRPWTLFAWIALTLGIALGSWWAYYELGWGGFWAWDPVENASLMPWLAGTALLHSVSVLEKRGSLKSWTIFLAILAFSLSLLGTFLVRSGVLTSVHSFALDPARGVWILTLLGASVGGALVLFAWRAPALQSGQGFGLVSREGLLIANNLLLTTAASAVFIGTLYPLLLEALTGGRITVGPPYFQWTFAPLAAGLFLLVPLGPRAGWNETAFAPLLLKLWPALAAATLAALCAALLLAAHQLYGALWFALALWLIGGSLCDLARRVRWREAGAFARARLLPLPVYGFLLAHAGLGVIAAGVAGVTAGQRETIAALAPGETTTLGALTLTLERVDLEPGPDYMAERGIVRVTKGLREIALLRPARRFYPVQARQTTEAAIRTDLLGDLYVVLGEALAGEPKRYALHGYLNPLAPWIWLGAGLTALGGALSLLSRRSTAFARTDLPAQFLAAGAE